MSSLHPRAELCLSETLSCVNSLVWWWTVVGGEAPVDTTGLKENKLSSTWKHSDLLLLACLGWRWAESEVRIWCFLHHSITVTLLFLWWRGDDKLEMQPRGVCINSVAFTSSGESFHHSALLANISKRRDIIISVPLWLLELPRQIYQAVALGQKWETWGKWWLVLGASAVTAGVQVGPTRQANSAYPCQSFSPFHKPH